ncbi:MULTISPECIES: hypothetical protein [Herbaspirillum]|uniref:Uncharacterized protein n=2 Tax=Herbaspirillum huttiense TaxID=863372 RepID=A0AAJ2HAM0_9BURK|nr:MULTISPECIES: hypothetical protein [Herbaspirillum]MDR9836961.1 hypothetical protein [Herbaspirillum huttiense]
MKKSESNDQGLHITEGVSGTWFYHLSAAGTNARGLCGAQTMYTAIPLASWGAKGHLNERYCADCQRLGESELLVAGASIAV